MCPEEAGTPKQCHGQADVQHDHTKQSGIGTEREPGEHGGKQHHRCEKQVKAGSECLPWARLVQRRNPVEVSAAEPPKNEVSLEGADQDSRDHGYP